MIPDIEYGIGLTMLNPGQRQALKTNEDHHHTDDPGTHDRVAVLLRRQVLEELEDGRVRSTASRVDVSSG